MNRVECQRINSTKDTCSATADPDYLAGFPNLFAYEAKGCVYIPVEYGGNYKFYCEHNGGEGANVFTS